MRLGITQKVRARFLSNIDHVVHSGCWIWNGYKHKCGYGYFYIRKKAFRAHRLSYEIFNKKIPVGLYCLHRCDNPPCVNPSHLFIGTQKDNIQDMIRKNGHYHANRTHCGNGHKFTKTNTAIYPTATGKGWKRKCIACSRKRSLEWKKKNKTQNP